MTRARPRTKLITTKCPHCGTRTGGRVDAALCRAGGATIVCHYCKKTVRLGQVAGFWEHMLLPFRDLRPRTARILPFLAMVLVFVAGLIVVYFAVPETRIDRDTLQRILTNGGVAMVVVVYYFYVARHDASGKLRRSPDKADPDGVAIATGAFPPPGSLVQRRGPGSTRDDAIKVSSIREEINYVELQRCPRCGSPFTVTSQSILTEPNMDHVKWMRRVAAGRPLQLCDRITGACEHGHAAEFYFDINDIPYIKGMRHSPLELFLHHVGEYLKQTKRDPEDHPP